MPAPGSVAAAFQPKRSFIRLAGIKRPLPVVGRSFLLFRMNPCQPPGAEQRFERLGHGLYQHSPRAYATLIMHRRDGISLQEIAQQFGVSYTMAKRYLSKALTYCEQRLDETE